MKTASIWVMWAILSVWSAPTRADATPATWQSGDLSRSYRFPPTGETLRYRLHVPPRKDAHPYGLVVILHGYGGDENSAFDGAPPGSAGELQKEADRHQFLLAAPAGYTGRGDYGAHLPLPGAPNPLIHHSAREDDLALADVMQVVRRVAAEFPIDAGRVYLMGNSMGMTGTLLLAEKYPNHWCAIAPSDGPPWPAYPARRLRYLSGALFVNGALDHLALSSVNRALAERVRQEGVDSRFLEVPDGDHGSAWYRALPAIFDFFAAHPCARAALLPR